VISVGTWTSDWFVVGKSGFSGSRAVLWGSLRNPGLRQMGGEAQRTIPTDSIKLAASVLDTVLSINWRRWMQSVDWFGCCNDPGWHTMGVMLRRAPSATAAAHYVHR
jgi:hypothetical protein